MDKEILTNIMQQLVDLTTQVQSMMSAPKKTVKSSSKKGAVKKTTEKKPVKKKASRSGKRPHPSHVDDFVMNPNKANEEASKKVPVKATGKNLFKDDLKTAKNVKTPKVNLTPRDRPKHKKKKLICEKCQKPYEDPLGTSEFKTKKICNSCLCKGVRDED